MNIVHVITSLDVGGAELMLLRLCRSLSSSGDKNIVICLFSTPETRSKFSRENIDVIDLQVSKSFGGLCRFIYGFLAIRSRCNIYPDVIQGWLPHGNILALLLKFIFYRRAFLVWNIRQSLHTWGTNSRMTKWLIKLGARLSSCPDVILFNSYRGLEQHAKIGYSTLKAKVIANGFDLAAFDRASLSPDFKKSVGIRDGALTVVHLGRRDPTKDHPAFFRAAVQVLKKYPSTYFMCVGRGVTFDDAELAELVPQDLRRQFIFLGQRSDVPQILLSSDIYCSSSAAEAFSNAIGEAMAAGLPCVVTDVGDSKIIVDNTGLVVPPGDPEALAAALEKILLMQQDERRSLGNRARQRIHECYSMERITQEYVETYRLCRGPKSF